MSIQREKKHFLIFFFFFKSHRKKESHRITFEWHDPSKGHLCIFGGIFFFMQLFLVKHRRMI